jgi:apolipoprotein N-acyltransferase
MKRTRTNGFGFDLLWLGLGSAAYALIGWRWSAPAAAWIAPVFLLRFFRNQQKWYATLPAIVPLPLFLVLYIDRALSPRLGSFGSTLVFPAAYVTMDYLVGFTPLGTLFSFGSTQFGFTTIVQTASITGIWGISFLITWFASIVNTAWENSFDLRMGGALPRAASNPALVFTAAALLFLSYGSVRIATSPSRVQTVRVAGITVEHPRDYWALLDRGSYSGPRVTVWFLQMIWNASSPGPRILPQRTESISPRPSSNYATAPA